MILSGRLSPGSRLPSTRELAKQYQLARGTIVAAIEELISQGYLHGRGGSGTYVSASLPEQFLQVTKRDSTVGVGLRDADSARPIRAFRTDLPAIDLFPMDLWRSAVSKSLRGMDRELLAGCEPMGYKPLRRAIAEYLTSSRGVRCVPEQILIVSGTQEALHLTARQVVRPGDRIGMEDPGYPDAVGAFRSAGAEIVPFPIDESGLVPDGRLTKGLRLLYVTPGHQYPLGVAMGLQRRLDILNRAKAEGFLVFEDDYDSEYRYSGKPIPALHGLDPAECVLFAGSFSKVLFPAIRLGYLVVPARMIDEFSAAKYQSSRHCVLLEQMALARFMHEGSFALHVRRMRQVYSERLGALMESAAQELGGLVQLSPIEAGLQTVGWLAPGLDEERSVKAAARRGVQVSGLRQFGLACEIPPGLVLGFGALMPGEIRRGTKELARALREG